MFEELKEAVCRANRDLVRHGLVLLTWGNVSGFDRARGLMAIKPSGVPYESLKPEDIVVVDEEGRNVEGELQISSDTPIHLELYRAFSGIGGIAHAHSLYGTMFAQACREIPCLGTTHADNFLGPIPVTRFLTEEEILRAYEHEIGKVIVERFAGKDPLATPAVLVAGHGPFVWGATAAEAVRNSLILERVAHMAWGTLALRHDLSPLPDPLQKKHFQRKHGPKAYYGQKNQS